MRRLIALLCLLPAVGQATPGLYGTDVKIKSKTGKIYVIEQAGYAIKVDATKLPKDIELRWQKSIGKTIESAVPYAAILEDKKINDARPAPVSGR